MHAPANNAWLAHEERFLARLGVSRGLVSAEQVRLAEVRQQQYHSQGVAATLPQVLIKMQLLSKDQIQELIRVRKQGFVLCNACGHVYARRELQPSTSMPCEKCRVPIDVPPPDGMTDEGPAPAPLPMSVDPFASADEIRLEATMEVEPPSPGEDETRHPSMDRTVEVDPPRPDEYSSPASDSPDAIQTRALGPDRTAPSAGWPAVDPNAPIPPEAPTVNLAPDETEYDRRAWGGDAGPAWDDAASAPPSDLFGDAPSAFASALPEVPRDEGAPPPGGDEAPTMNLKPENNPALNGGPGSSEAFAGMDPAAFAASDAAVHRTLELNASDLATAGLNLPPGTTPEEAAALAATAEGPPSSAPGIDVSDLYQQGRIASSAQVAPADEEATIVTGGGSGSPSSFGTPVPFAHPSDSGDPFGAGSDPFGAAGSDPFGAAAPPSGFGSGPGSASGPFGAPAGLGGGPASASDPFGVAPASGGYGVASPSASDPFGLGAPPGAGSNPMGGGSNAFGAVGGTGGGGGRPDDGRFHGAPTVVSDDPMRAFGAPPPSDAFGSGGGFGAPPGGGGFGAPPGPASDPFAVAPASAPPKSTGPGWADDDADLGAGRSGDGADGAGSGKKSPVFLGVAVAVMVLLVGVGYALFAAYQSSVESERLQRIASLEGKLVQTLAEAPTGQPELKASFDEADALLDDTFLEADVHFVLGVIKRHLGEYHAAVDHFGRAIESAESQLEGDGVDSDAAAYLESADAAVDHIPARYSRAFVRAWFLADRSSARTDIEQIAKVAPGSPYGPAGEAMLLLLEGDLDQAEAKLAEAERLSAELIAFRPPAPPSEDPEAGSSSSIEVLAQRSTAATEIALLRGFQKIRRASALADDDETRERIGSSALEALTAAVLGQPNDFLAYALRAEAHLILGDDDAGREDAARAIKINPSDPRGYVARGRVQLAARDARAAVDDFRKAVDKDRNNVDALVWRATALKELKDTQRALKDLNRALELVRDDERALWLRARLQFEMENYRRAVDDLGRLLDIDPENRASRRLLADCNRARKMWKAAHDQYDKLLGDESDDLEGLLARAECLVELSRHSKAVTDLKRVIEAQEAGFERGRAHYLLSRAYIGLRKPDDAKKAADQAVRVDANVAEYYQARGRAQLALGTAQPAVDDFLQAKRLRPSLPDINADLEQARRRLPNPGGRPPTGGQPGGRPPPTGGQPGGRPPAGGQPGGRPPPTGGQPGGRPPAGGQPAQPTLTAVEAGVLDQVRALLGGRPQKPNEAIRVLEEGVAKVPSSIALNATLGTLYVQMHRFPEALPVLNAVLRQAPTHPSALSMRGQLHFQTGNYPKAMSDFAKVLERDPLHQNALNGLTVMFLRTGRANDALPLAQKAYEVRRTMPNAINFARSLAGTGNHADAVLRYTEAVDMFEAANRAPDPDIIGERGMSYASLRDEDKAKADAESLFASGGRDGFAHLILAQLAAAQGEKTDAFAAFRKAHGLLGQRLNVKTLRGSALAELLKTDPEFKALVQ